MSTLLNKEKKHIELDISDWTRMCKLIDRHEEFDSQYSGKNEQGQDVNISVNADSITVLTFQSNGWTRENIYHRDCTVEELYHRP